MSDNRKFVITIVAEAHDENIVQHHNASDYIGADVTEEFIRSYLAGAYQVAGSPDDGAADLAPGIVVESVTVEGISDGHLSRYRQLEADSRKLARLEAAGVDNWEGYHLAFSDEDEDEDA